MQSCIAGWTSLPIGVVNLAERHGGREVGRENYEAMVADVMAALTSFEGAYRFRERISKGCAHFLGTSGTVTTIAGIHLGLPAYDRSRVDGCWLGAPDARRVSDALIDMSYASAWLSLASVRSAPISFSLAAPSSRRCSGCGRASACA